MQVVSSLILGGMLMSETVNLRQSGNARFRDEPLAMPIGVMPSSLDAFRAGSDQAHLAAQDIEQLGQFRDAEFLQQAFETWRFGCRTD